MTTQANPVFWRDPRMPYIELRQVDDGRQVRYAPHSHRQWSLGAITGGQSTFFYRDNEYVVSAGDLVLMNPEWVHNCNPIADQPWAYLMMYIDTPWLSNLRHTNGLSQTADWQDISTAVISETTWYDRYRQLTECLQDPHRALLVKQAELIEFLSDLMRELAGEPLDASPQVPEPLTTVVAYIDANVHKDVSLDDLCALSGYSPGHLIRAFRQHFNLTPHAYLINRRIQQGRGELMKGATIVEAALNAGFADQPHFQRTFKRLMAATPNQYRRCLIDKQVDATGSK